MLRQSVELSVVIPCYNEGELLNGNFNRLYHELLSVGKTFEIVFVDDCSQDETVQTITEICAEFDCCKSIYNHSNLGRGATFMIGADQSEGGIVGFLDIDLEVSEVYLRDVLHELDKGAEVVSVYRTYKLKWNPIFLIRAFLSNSYKVLVRSYLKVPLKDTESGFKFFKSDVYHELRKLCKSNHWFWDTEVMAHAYWEGYDVREVKGEFIKNKNKRSTVRIVPDTLEYLKEIKHFKRRMKNRN